MGQIVNNEYKRLWVKAQAVLACCKVLSQQKPREIDKNHTTVNSTARLWTKI